MSLFPGFENGRVATSGDATINCIGGAGEPVLLLHANPETHVSWPHVPPVRHRQRCAVSGVR